QPDRSRRLTHAQEALAAAHPCERDQIPIAEPVTDRQRILERGERRRGVAIEEALQRARDEEVPGLYAVRLCRIQHTLPPGHPSAAASGPPGQEEEEAQVERPACGTGSVAPFERGVERALPQFACMAFATGEIGGHGKPLERSEERRVGKEGG